MNCDAFWGIFVKILYGICFTFIYDRFTEIRIQSWRWWRR